MLGQELFNFIQQLDKSEKRAFKIYLKKYTGQKHLNIIYIFDILNKRKVFDKKKFNALLLKRIDKNKLSFEQFKLKRYLLNALTDLQQKKNELHIGDIINKIELSLKYKMPEMALEWIKKGQSYAKGKEATALRAILLRYELQYKELIKEEKETLQEQTKACIKELKEETEYAILKNKFYKAYRENIYLKNEASEQKIEELAKDHLFLEDSLADTFQKRNYLFYAKMLHAAYKENFDLELVYSKKLVENYEDSAHIIPQRIRIYVTLNKSLILSYKKNGLYEKGHQRLEYLKTLVDRYAIENVKILGELESICLYAQMILLSGEEKYQEIYDNKETIESFLQKQDSDAPFFNTSFFVYVMAKSLFYVQDFEECLKWINNFLQIAPKNKFQKGFLELQFLQFAVQYELGNFFLLDSILNSINYLITKYELPEKTYSYFHRSLKLFKEKRYEEINHDKLIESSETKQAYLWLQEKLKNK